MPTEIAGDFVLLHAPILEEKKLFGIKEKQERQVDQKQEKTDIANAVVMNFMLNAIA